MQILYAVFQLNAQEQDEGWCQKTKNDPHSAEVPLIVHMETKT